MSPSSFVPGSTAGSQRTVLSVSQLNALIRDALQATFPRVWVSGEVTDLSRPQSGHVYLSLKDDQSQLRAVMWRTTASRLRFDLKDGMEILCEGMIDVYPPRGTYQLIVQQIEPRGMGALQLALMQLREKLAAEGLFDPAHKQPLPRFPRQIVVITSPTGAAVRDFLEVVRRRWRGTQILVIPTRVQGAEATEEIIQAIRTAHRLRPQPEVLVLARGGGSLEDLWCFNEERLVREIHAARIPVISAIGHEIDVTLTDLVADLRALTPTEAGEHAVPSQTELWNQLHSLARLMSASLGRRWQVARDRVEALAQRRVLVDPHQLIRDRMHQLDEFAGRMNRAVLQRQRYWRQQTDQWTGRLETLNPLAVLERGYSLTQRSADQAIIRDSHQVQPGDEIRTHLASGHLISRVIETLDDSPLRNGPRP